MSSIITMKVSRVKSVAWNVWSLTTRNVSGADAIAHVSRPRPKRLFTTRF
ncbi:MAG TPA: hypothetical protein VGC66_04230 [Pyrinomonadaceae bacterium]